MMLAFETYYGAVVIYNIFANYGAYQNSKPAKESERVASSSQEVPINGICIFYLKENLAL